MLTLRLILAKLIRKFFADALKTDNCMFTFTVSLFPKLKKRVFVYVCWLGLSFSINHTQHKQSRKQELFIKL